ncbi:MAG: lipopolysaccharide transport periplasmic protein LptA [Thermodesulfobacteriota bacterium]|nr:lipopolysaccharide transport periplasmic protein LptA [Thermodesulfobacteriota bacterium]
MELKVLIRRIILITIPFLYMSVFLVFNAPDVLCKDGKFELKGEGQPITINSDRLEGDNKRNTVTFSGNVIAKRGNVSIYSDSISIVYDEINRDVREVIAKGNVRVTMKDREATGHKAIFLNSEEKIILTGNPKVKEGDNIINGGRIILFLGEDRGIVEADEHTRVKATINIENKRREK